MSSERKRTRPLPRTPVALSVLNLLAERPMHPYEMRVLMRQRHHDRTFRELTSEPATDYPAFAAPQRAMA